MSTPKTRVAGDYFTLYLVATVVFASFLPVRGELAAHFDWVTDAAVGLLFFLHGARLSREAIIAGGTNWRLHAAVFISTFVLFPLLGLLLKPIISPFVTPSLYTGILFLCTMPSTVQSSIAFTSMARGNVPAAVCSASASSLIGIFISPALVGLLVATSGSAKGSSLGTVLAIVLQLFVPFLAGQLLRPLIGAWAGRNAALLKWVDQGSILLVVYGAFSEAVVQGLWRNTPLNAIGGMVVADIVLLALALLLTSTISKYLGFSRADQITIIFCGSKKSLASGVPMARVMFASHTVGAIVLPLMFFHQIQLMTCAVLAQRWGKEVRPPETSGTAAGSAVDAGH